METINYTITGVEPLLLNNPQTVDPFNKYSRDKKVITGKRKKTDEDLLELRRLEVEAKLYFDDELKVFIPSTWITSAIAANSWNRVKVKKAEIRSAVFACESKIKLRYKGERKVKEKCDISGNPEFVTTLLLKQGQVKIAKCAPIFNDWLVESSLEFDPAIIDRASVIQLLEYATNYGGLGDFRPTYGRSLFTEVAA